MPYAPSRPCTHPRCPNMAPCPTHTRKAWQRTSPYEQPGGSGYEWQRIRQRVIERDGGLCHLHLPGCTTYATTADHIKGKAAGGSDKDSNLQASCKNCNEMKRRQQSIDGRTKVRR